jgi:excisionase family DNA binding protein
MPTDQGGSIFTIEELAEYLKISKSTLYKLAQGGSIPGQKVGKHWRFHKDAVDLWLRQRGPIATWPQTDSEK